MRARAIFLSGAVAAAILATPMPSNADGADLSFQVTNLHDGNGYSVRGSLFEPDDCDASAVVVLMHGLSYTREAWNLDGYSVVEPILDAGYAVVTIDRLGYGQSVLDDGYQISSEGHAYIAGQIIEQLRTGETNAGSFEEVVLGGHSAGAEASLLAAGLFGAVQPEGISAPDAVAGLGYHHFPSQQIITDFFTGDYLRAAQDDYEYFLGTEEHRQWMFFTEFADPDVVAADAAAAVLTPSGEVFSIGKQPSRYLAASIDIPVFLQFGDSDRLFPVEFVDQEAALFASAPSVTVDVVENSGHTFMLHPAGIAGSERLANWLTDSSNTSGC